ncbi:MAG: AAA family ATPase [Solirubrobacteraceae bacterium]
MRIAFSGSHRVGKSTLIERVAEALPSYAVVAEPYYLLEEEGYECSDPPSAEDFEAQLDRSIIEFERATENVLFDRCPADFLAYLLVGGHDVEAHVERVHEAIQSLDLLVLVPIEEPDRVAVSSDEDRAQRREVSEELCELLFDEDLAEEVLVVHGDVTARVAQVLARVDGLAGQASCSSRVP